MRGANIQLRIGYDDIAYVTSVHGGFEADRLQLVMHDGSKLNVGFPKHDHGLGPLIERRMRGLEEYRFTGDSVDGSITLTYHPWRRDIMSYWEWSRLPLLKGEVVRLRQLAGRALLSNFDLAEGGEPFERANNPSAINWTDAVTALVRHHGLETPFLWTIGHAVAEGLEKPVVVGVAQHAYYLMAFETLRGAMEARRAPEIVVNSYQNVADWEVRRQPDGKALLRLLEFRDHGLKSSSLEEALQDRTAFGIRLVGLADPSRVETISEAIIDGIKSFGAYSPATRDSHPLQIGS